MCAVGCWRHVLRRGGGAAAAAPRGARVWREVRQWERGRERVSVCLFVTLCHLSKYSCIVVRCESPRVWVSSSLLLLRFSKTVTGPLGRHSNYWAERIRFLFPKEKLLFSGRTKSGLLRGSPASSASFLSSLECRREAEQLLPFALRRTFFRWPLRRLTVWQHVTLPNLRQFSLFRRPRRLRQSGKLRRLRSLQLVRNRTVLPPSLHPTPASPTAPD